MQVIDLDALHLITPVNLDPEKRLNYYSPYALHPGDILFHSDGRDTRIFRVLTAVNVRQKRPVTLRNRRPNAPKGNYLSRLYLSEIDERSISWREAHEKVCDTIGIPF